MSRKEVVRVAFALSSGHIVECAPRKNSQWHDWWVILGSWARVGAYGALQVAVRRKAEACDGRRVKAADLMGIVMLLVEEAHA